MTAIDQWERVRTNKGWHIRFRSANTEIVVAGENLTSLAACDTAIVSVARAHAPLAGAAEVARIRKTTGGYVLRLRDQHGHMVTWVPVVDVDERKVVTRTARVVGAVTRRVTR